MLFHRGLATNENLTAIFGNSSMVSYRLYELRKIKAGIKQASHHSLAGRRLGGNDVNGTAVLEEEVNK